MAIGGTLKANLNKLLTIEKINEMFAEFRAASQRLNGSNGALRPTTLIAAANGN
jgi:hypothetical protein